MKLTLEYTDKDGLGLNTPNTKFFTANINGVTILFETYNSSYHFKDDGHWLDMMRGLGTYQFKIEAYAVFPVCEKERKAQEAVDKAKESLKAAEAALKAVKEKE